MTYEQALAITKRAFEEALRLHGWDRAKAYEEMMLREDLNPQLREAFIVVGLHDTYATRH
ncbi:hypothetical protein DXK93_27285 [Achromobacter sp. K91]|uniref:hypothetical protein n=1 Tax=Achromobacter TaxID=222 RepID=UPI000E672FE6|nr:MULTISPECIES: hypothetical protein [Achromobacter]RIJ00268.1 hypothetical protein DXK93_27285 [Achromobacter sp. K91]WLW64289.1 hypothetical protein RA224_12930 [Achromobacter aegrifaciens]